MTEVVRVIDISHWQGFPDFARVKEAGVLGVIMKATEGTGYVDPNRRQNFVNATAVGLYCCCYFWLKPGDGAAQARFFLDTVDPVAGERVVIDYEEDGCTLDMLKDAIAELLDDARDLQITVYSGHLLKEQLGSKHDAYLAEYTDLWLAHYTSGAPTWPSATYPEWRLWQYTDQGAVGGINPCDLDRFNGSDAELIAWLKPRGAEPAPEPEPEPDAPLVRVAIEVPDGVNLILSVNGVPVR